MKNMLSLKFLKCTEKYEFPLQPSAKKKKKLKTGNSFIDFKKKKKRFHFQLAFNSYIKSVIDRTYVVTENVGNRM